MKRRRVFVLFLILCAIPFLSAQKVVKNLLSEKSLKGRTSYEQLLQEYRLVEYNKAIVPELVNSPVEYLSFEVPLIKQEVAILDMINNDFIFKQTMVTTSSGLFYLLDGHEGRHFRGGIRETKASIAAVSLFDDEIVGIISNDQGNIVLGKHREEEAHIIYNTQQLEKNHVFECCVEMEEEMNSDLQAIYDSLSVDDSEEVSVDTPKEVCVQIYYECKYDMYRQLGSVEEVVKYVTAVHNQVATLFLKEGIKTPLSEIKVWDTEDPYTATNTSTLLQQFKNNTTSFNGDLAQLLTFESLGGGRAYLGTVCRDNPKVRTSVACISRYFNTVPTYSWTVYVMTHELGHLLGSYHTHACVWNGNNTPIDGCSRPEGSCAEGPIPTEGGTMMSYCHLHQTGVNFSLGFGLQPSKVINKRIRSGLCVKLCNPVTGFQYPIANEIVSGEKKLRIYREGNTGVFQITTDQPMTGSIVLVAMTGQIVFSGTLHNQSEYSIDIKNQPAGIYLVNLRTATHNYSGKLQKVF